MSDQPAPAAATSPAPIDPTKVRMVQELKHTSALFGCRIDPTGEFVFAGAQNNSLVRWNLASGQKTEFLGHKSWLRGIAFAAKEKLVFSADYQGKLLAWPIAAEQPAPLIEITAHTGWARALAVSPDGKLLASCGNDRLVKLWSIPDLKPIGELSGHESHVYNIAFHPTEPLLVSADHKGILKVWDLAKRSTERELDAKLLFRFDTLFSGSIGGIRAMSFSDNGQLLACAGITNVTNAFAGVGTAAIVLFDWTTGKQLHLLQNREPFSGTAWGAAFHPAGFLVGVAGHDNSILSFWKPDAAADFFTLKLTENARDLSLHPDGHRFAIPFSDGAIRVYDLSPAASQRNS